MLPLDKEEMRGSMEDFITKTSYHGLEIYSTDHYYRVIKYQGLSGPVVVVEQ